MLGNCATGRLNMVIVPTITMTMEITMATMGRLIKNFDIGLPSLRFRGKWLGVYLHARTHLLHAFGNHAFASLQSFRDNPICAHTGPDLNRMYAHFFLAADPHYLTSAMQLRTSALRSK